MHAIIGSLTPCLTTVTFCVSFSMVKGLKFMRYHVILILLIIYLLSCLAHALYVVIASVNL